MDIKKYLQEQVFTKQNFMLFVGFSMIAIGGGIFFLSSWFKIRGLDEGAVNVMKFGAGGWFAAGVCMALWERAERSNSIKERTK